MGGGGGVRVAERFKLCAHFLSVVLLTFLYIMVFLKFRENNFSFMLLFLCPQPKASILIYKGKGWEVVSIYTSIEMM